MGGGTSPFNPIVLDLISSHPKTYSGPTWGCRFGYPHPIPGGNRGSGISGSMKGFLIPHSYREGPAYPKTGRRKPPQGEQHRPHRLSHLRLHLRPSPP